MPSPKIIHIHDADAAASPNHIGDLRSRIEKRDRSLPTMVKKTPAGRAWTTKDVPEPLVPYRPILAYIMGPLAGLVTPAGRSSREWMVLGIVSAAAWISSIWLLAPLGALVRQGNLLGWAGAVAAVVLLGIGFLAWCRGLVFATPRRGAVAQAGWSTRSSLVGPLGAIAPGLGLAIVGRSRRAAAALLNAGFLLLCVLVLAAAGSLWTGSEAMPRIRPVLEWVFLGAAVGSFLNVITWIVLALEGVRLVPGPRSAAKRWGRWGDAFAAALLISVVAFALLFRPAPLAQQLDESGVLMTANGYRLLPGFLFRAAMHLDPSQTVYVLHAAELEETIGNEEGGRVLRQELDRRIQPVLARGEVGVGEPGSNVEVPVSLVELPPGMAVTTRPDPDRISLPERSAWNGPRAAMEIPPESWQSIPLVSGIEEVAPFITVAPPRDPGNVATAQ